MVAKFEQVRYSLLHGSLSISLSLMLLQPLLDLLKSVHSRLKTNKRWISVMLVQKTLVLSLFQPHSSILHWMYLEANSRRYSIYRKAAK